MTAKAPHQLVADQIEEFRKSSGKANLTVEDILAATSGFTPEQLDAQRRYERAIGGRYIGDMAKRRRRR